jgi:hypothetical protein
MTIARNVELVDSNWSGGSVGSGFLYKGNTGVDNAAGYNNTGNVDYGTTRNSKAKLTLSNGEEIWDFSGNVYEITTWTAGAVLTKGPTDGDSGVAREVTETHGSITSNDIQGNSNYTSAQGLGQWFAAPSGGVAIRGGGASASDEPSIGVYFLFLEYSETDFDADIGFRCVWRP